MIAPKTFTAADWGRITRGTPPRMDLGRVVEMTVHYTGAKSVNRAPEQIPSYLKATERHQMAKDPAMSAVAYNFAIDKWGRVWELRGWSYRNAANGTSSNVTSFSVCLLIGVEDNDPNPNVIHALQWLYAEGSRRTGRTLTVRGHQEHKPTSCPGASVMRLIRSGVIQNARPVVAPPPAPTPAPQPPAPPSRPTLRRGSSGAAVRELQTLLQQRGFYAGMKVDGAFGPRTEAEVKRFQSAARITADGIVGRQTWAALEAPTPNPTPVAPPKPELPAATYTVRAGDSYWRIAQTVLGRGSRWREVSDLNGGKALTPGQVIKVPRA